MSIRLWAKCWIDTYWMHIWSCQLKPTWWVGQPNSGGQLKVQPLPISICQLAHWPHLLLDTFFSYTHSCCCGKFIVSYRKPCSGRWLHGGLGLGWEGQLKPVWWVGQPNWEGQIKVQSLPMSIYLSLVKVSISTLTTPASWHHHPFKANLLSNPT